MNGFLLESGLHYAKFWFYIDFSTQKVHVFRVDFLIVPVGAAICRPSKCVAFSYVFPHNVRNTIAALPRANSQRLTAQAATADIEKKDVFSARSTMRGIFATASSPAIRTLRSSWTKSAVSPWPSTASRSNTVLRGRKQWQQMLLNWRLPIRRFSDAEAGNDHHRLCRKCAADWDCSEVVLFVRSFPIVSGRKIQKSMV